MGPRPGVLSALLVVAGTLAAGAAQAAQFRLALVVGNNAGNDGARTLRYAEQEVTRLAGILQHAGSFDDTVILRGADRADVERALATVAAALSSARAAGRDTLFLFYYSGHGDNEALELGRTRLPLRDLRTYLERLPADVRLAFIDACQSGALSGVKGGRRTDGYEIRLADSAGAKGLAILTSSTARELSQESDDLGGSYFSHNIMAGLQGLADASGDGRVTLSELYLFAFQRTVAGTAVNLAGGQHPTYDYRLSGAGDVVLTQTRPSDGHLRFPRETGATYAVFSRRELAVEVTSSGDQELNLALPAGPYRVVRRSLAQVSERWLDITPGATLAVDPAQMAPVVAREEGAHRKKRSPSSSQTLAAHMAVTSTVVEGTSPLLVGGGVAYGLRLSSLQIRARADLMRFEASVPGYRSTLVRLIPSLDLSFLAAAFGPVDLFLGLQAGMPAVWQRDSTTVHRSFGGQSTAFALVQLPLGGPLWLEATVAGGAELFRLDGRIHTTPVAAGTLGGALRY